MNNSQRDSQSTSGGQRGSNVKKASVASAGATVLLVVGYLIASGLGIPLDGLNSQTPSSQQADSQAPDLQQADSQVPDLQQPDPRQQSRERSLAVAADRQAKTDATTDAPRAVANRSSSTGAKSRQAVASQSFQIENVTIRNLDGKVVFRGTVDLTETMRRIDAGRRLESFRNDGTTFQNRERRLPNKKSGYYSEYVHPTPKLGGPGPQRVITGKEGEAYYTFDHYKTFQKIR